ncbi:hypothetical protein NMY22_g1875 [Coprinellus aureogranulatus]|nr:hypothetical protein NMY22_g1875 [Coprinellus aureogranulatus]
MRGTTTHIPTTGTELRAYRISRRAGVGVREATPISKRRGSIQGQGVGVFTEQAGGSGMKVGREGREREGERGVSQSMVSRKIGRQRKEERDGGSERCKLPGTTSTARERRQQPENYVDCPMFDIPRGRGHRQRLPPKRGNQNPGTR